MDKLDSPLKNYKKALDIRKNSLPWYHALIIKSYSNTAKIYEAMEKYDLMIKYSNIKLDILKKILPANHFDIQYLEEQIQYKKNILEPPVKSLRELETDAFYSSDFDQALNYYQQAIDEELKSSNVDYANLFDIYCEIAEVYAKKNGNQDSAISYLRKLIEDHYADDTLHSAIIYEKIVDIYSYKLRNNEEALRNYEKCLEIRTKLLPIDDQLISSAENHVEWIHLGKIDYKQMIEFRKKTFRNGIE